MTENINWGEVVVPVGLVGQYDNYKLAQEPIMFCAMIEDLTVAKNMGRKALSVYVQRDLFYRLQGRYYRRGPVTNKYVNGRRVWYIDGVRVHWTKGRDPYYIQTSTGRLQ